MVGRSSRVTFALALLAGVLAVPSSTPAAAATTWRLPLPTWTLSGYGFGDAWRFGSCGGQLKRHTGFDAAARAGDPVRAAANGKIYGTYFESRWGYMMLVEHAIPGEGTVITRYSHVRPRAGYGAGRVVSVGEQIATIYNLGGNTHLAFDVHMGAYTRWAWRGALPRTNCGGDPAFPWRFVDPTRFVRVHQDFTPPTTAIIATRSVSSERIGWTKGTWTIAFRCRDAAAGCARTQVRLDGGSVFTAPSAWTLRAEGRHIIHYRSIDKRGNVEGWRSKMLGIDRTAPAGQMREPATAFATGSQVEFEAAVADPPSGNPASSSRMWAVPMRYCPAERVDNTSCTTVYSSYADGVWRGRPTSTLGPGSYEVWARPRDSARNASTTASIVFVVLA